MAPTTKKMKLAHKKKCLHNTGPDEPYMEKYGKFVETRFHELEHESKMRLLKTHSHTSERRDYEADKELQEKKE